MVDDSPPPDPVLPHRLLSAVLISLNSWGEYLPFDELVAMYVAADVMVVTPLVDGMNLVAKEYVASRADDTGVLVLSEFAGAAEEFKSALLVNPHDVDTMTEVMARALEMPKAEQMRRMRSMRRVLEHNTVHDWARRFLEVLEHAT